MYKYVLFMYILHSSLSNAQISNESYSTEDAAKLSNWEAKCISEAPVRTADQIAQCIQNQRRGYANMPQLRNGGLPIASQRQTACDPLTARTNCQNAVRSISQTDSPHELNSSDRSLIVANCRTKCNIETGSVELQINGCTESVKYELETYLSSNRQRCSFPEMESNSEISDYASNEENADDNAIDEPSREETAEPASSSTPSVQTQINLCRANRSGQCSTILDGGIAFTSAPIDLPGQNQSILNISYGLVLPGQVSSNETEFESGEMMSTLSSLSSNSIRNNNIANNGRMIASQPGNLGAIGDKSSVKNLSSLINTITFGFFSRTEDLEEDRSKQRGSFQSQISKKKRKRHIKDCGMDLRCIANYISSKAKQRPKGRSLASVRKNQFENIWVSNTDILTHMHDVYGKFRLDPNGEVIH